jgi:hypothetical protein
VSAVAGFAQRAQELLEAAVAGPSGSEITVLIGHDGRLELCNGAEGQGSEWPLEALVRERGARAGYRVCSRGNTVRVEGREGLRTCVLESLRSRWFLA